MSKKKEKNNAPIKFIDDKKQKEMQEAVKQKFGDKRVNEYNRNINSLTKEQQQQTLNECNEIFAKFAEHIHTDPYSEEVRDLLIQWHHWIKKFYEPSMELLRDLGTMYAMVPDFRKTFEAIDNELPDFLPKAINYYVDELEEKWLQEQYNTLEH
jgi:hypothetical protein